nr:hypothetical protein [uncultured Desulfobulbus sp.]
MNHCSIFKTTSLLCLLLSFTLFCQFGCSENGSTLGNGQVDQVEAATIRVAVGLALTARPDTAAPAYAASTAILALLDEGTGESALAATIDTALTAKLDELHLDAATKQSMVDLSLLIKAQILEQLGAANIGASAKKVLVRQVVAIVQQTAGARLGAGQP